MAKTSIKRRKARLAYKQTKQDDIKHAQSEKIANLLVKSSPAQQRIRGPQVNNNRKYGRIKKV